MQRSLAILISIGTLCYGCTNSHDHNHGPHTHTHQPAAVPVTAEMSAAAQAFYDSLTPEQQKQAMFEFADAERQNWAFTPVARKGLPWKSMTPEQRALGVALIKTGLSEKGYAKAEAIQALEEHLGQLENSNTRDPQNYYITLFGSPPKAGSTDPWGWRFEGHHLAFNFTAAGLSVSGAPNFLGSNPAEVRTGPQTGLRILADEEDVGRKLVTSLSDEQRAIAIMNARAPREIVTTNRKKVEAMALEGIPAAQLTTEQKAMLMELIQLYARRLRPEIADNDIAQITADGIDSIHFVWAGPIEPKAAHYYRVQGKTFLIEYDNSQNTANHIHSVWRDLTDDFGEDILKKHYEQSGAEHGH